MSESIQLTRFGHIRDETDVLVIEQSNILHSSVCNHKEQAAGRTSMLGNSA